MFTGIVTDVGRVRRLRRTGPEGGLDLSIATAYDTAEIVLGASETVAKAVAQLRDEVENFLKKVAA